MDDDDDDDGYGRIHLLNARKKISYMCARPIQAVQPYPPMATTPRLTREKKQKRGDSN